MFGISPIGAKFFTPSLSFRGEDKTPKQSGKKPYTQVMLLGNDVFTYTLNSENKIINRTANLNPPNAEEVAKRKFHNAQERGEDAHISFRYNPTDFMRELRKVEFEFGPKSKEFKEAEKVFQAKLAAYNARLKEEKAESAEQNKEDARVEIAQEAEKEPGKAAEPLTSAPVKEAKQGKDTHIKFALFSTGTKIHTSLPDGLAQEADTIAGIVDDDALDTPMLTNETIKLVEEIFSELADARFIKAGQSVTMGTDSGYTLQFGVVPRKPSRSGEYRNAVYAISIADNGKTIYENGRIKEAPMNPNPEGRVLEFSAIKRDLD